MTHILVDPLFPDHLSKYVDSQLLSSRGVTRSNLSRAEFDKIRSRSRQTWEEQLEFQDDGQKQVPLRSSYTAHYQTKGTRTKDNDCRLTSRATSPTRKNNPHPPLPFMVWHLHNAPGFEKTGSYKQSRAPYKVGYRGAKEVINQTKLVYGSAPDIRPIMKKNEKILQATLSDVAVPKAEAWIKQASSKDKEVVMDMLKACADQKYIDKNLDSVVKPEARASLHRYLKKAGREEQDAMVRLLKTLSFDPYESGHINRQFLDKQDPNRYTLGRYNSNRSTNGRYQTEQVVTRRFPYRTDFKHHPEWRP